MCIRILAAIAALLILSGCEFGPMPATDDPSYCDMVEIWNAEAAAGVPPEQRRGWPDYDRVFDEACS